MLKSASDIKHRSYQKHTSVGENASVLTALDQLHLFNKLVYVLKVLCIPESTIPTVIKRRKISNTYLVKRLRLCFQTFGTSLTTVSNSISLKYRTLKENSRTIRSSHERDKFPNN
jgi:hypothetical protein